MTKAAYIVILFIGLFTVQVNAYSLKISVENLRNSKGIIQFALYNKDGTIPDENFEKYYKIKKGTIENESSTISFDNLPKGIYAINILHDENKDGKIDKGFLLPTEGIGFSNYTSIGLNNKPNFKDASFELDSNLTKAIKIIYF